MSKSTVMAGMAVIAGLVVCVSVATAEVSVDLIGYQFHSGNSVWEYSYEIDNTTGADWIYYLELDPVDMATITGSPVAWDDLFYDTSIGGFASWSPTEVSDWLAPGETLDGFVIESIYGPGSDYVAWGLYGDTDGNDGGDSNYWDGPVGGPTLPEPCSVLTMMLALGMAKMAVRRRKRTE